MTPTLNNTFVVEIVPRKWKLPNPKPPHSWVGAMEQCQPLAIGLEEKTHKTLGENEGLQNGFGDIN